MLEPPRMLGGLLLLVGLTGALPNPPDVDQAPPSPSTLERVAFAFVDERTKAEASTDSTPDHDAPDGSAKVVDSAAALRDLFASSDDAAPVDDGAPDFSKLLATWNAADPWETTLASLHAPKAAIHFDDILTNARAEEETQAAVSATSAVLAARTEARTHAGSLADTEVCIAGVVVVAAILGALGIVLWALRRVARWREEVLMRNEALIVLASVIKSTEARPWSAELQLMLRNALRDRRSSECIRQLLRRHRELRLNVLRPNPA